MADVNKDRFLERLGNLEQKKNPKKRVVKKVREDGLVVDVVKRRRPKLIPVKSLLTLSLIFVMLKGFVLVQLGQDEYTQRIDALKAGHALEVVAAFFLDAYPPTQVMADGLNTVLGRT